MMGSHEKTCKAFSLRLRMCWNCGGGVKKAVGFDQRGENELQLQWTTRQARHLESEKPARPAWAAEWQDLRRKTHGHLLETELEKREDQASPILA